MTRQEDIWSCSECGQLQGRHDMWFDGDLCEKCNVTLYDTDFVVYDKANDMPVQFTDGRIVLYGDKDEAYNDCYRNEWVIPCTELPTHWKEYLIGQLKK